MILSEWLTSGFIATIPYISTNESDNADILTAMLLGYYGNRTISALTENIDNSETIAKIIDISFSDKWKNLKNIFDSGIPDVTTNGGKNVKTIENSVFGYDGSDAKDYKRTETTDNAEYYNDIFDSIEKNVAIHDKLSYYKVIVNDIAYVLTTPIYFDE